MVEFATACLMKFRGERGRLQAEMGMGRRKGALAARLEEEADEVLAMLADAYAEERRIVGGMIEGMLSEVGAMAERRRMAARKGKKRVVKRSSKVKRGGRVKQERGT